MKHKRFLVVNGIVRLLLSGNTVINGGYEIEFIDDTTFKIVGVDVKPLTYDKIISVPVPGNDYNELIMNAQQYMDEELLSSVDVYNNYNEYYLCDTENGAEEFTYTYNDNTSYMIWNTSAELQSPEMYENSSVPSINPKHIEYGCYRKSEKVAYNALALNKVTNRLHALVEQLDGFCEWTENSTENYTIVKTNKGYITEGNSYKNPSIVYMTLDCANEICNMINYGTFKLEGKI